MDIFRFMALYKCSYYYYYSSWSHHRGRHWSCRIRVVRSPRCQRRLRSAGHTWYEQAPWEQRRGSSLVTQTWVCCHWHRPVWWAPGGHHRQLFVTGIKVAMQHIMKWTTMEISACYPNIYMYLVFIYYAYVYNVLHFILNQSINQKKNSTAHLSTGFPRLQTPAVSQWTTDLQQFFTCHFTQQLLGQHFINFMITSEISREKCPVRNCPVWKCLAWKCPVQMCSIGKCLLRKCPVGKCPVKFVLRESVWWDSIQWQGVVWGSVT